MVDSRTATDVLLSVERKIEMLIDLLKNKDLSDKILSNKLNILINTLTQQKPTSLPIFTAEAAIDNNSSPISTLNISAEDSLVIESHPSSKGFSRTSRSETFAGDNSYIKKSNKKENLTPRMPIQVPKNNHVEIIVPQNAINTNQIAAPKNQIESVSMAPTNTVSVIQRVTDKNGKSLFLADVEIINKKDLQVVQKLKTNAVGKWMCSLPIGEYSVVVKKRDPITKAFLEVGQNIEINGNTNPLDLPVAIIKG